MEISALHEFCDSRWSTKLVDVRFWIRFRFTFTLFSTVVHDNTVIHDNTVVHDNKAVHDNTAVYDKSVVYDNSVQATLTQLLEVQPRHVHHCGSKCLDVAFSCVSCILYPVYLLRVICRPLNLVIISKQLFYQGRKEVYRIPYYYHAYQLYCWHVSCP